MEEKQTTFKVVKFDDQVIGTLRPNQMKTINGKLSGKYGEKYFPITIIGNSGFFPFVPFLSFALSNSIFVQMLRFP